jgi:hypothetical protein
MAAFTSKADGNWSAESQTTWTQTGKPGNGDTVTLSHNVTVDVDTTVGSSPDTDGTAAVAFSASVAGKTLTVAAGKVLTLKGDLTHAATGTGGISTVHLAAGSSLVFLPKSGATYKWRLNNNAYLTTAGTSGSHCTIKTDLSAGGGAAFMVSDNATRTQGAKSVAYTDFLDLGTDSAWGVQTIVQYPDNTTASITHCTFTRCNYLAKDDGGSYWQGTYLLQDCTFTDSVEGTWQGAASGHGFTFTDDTPTTAPVINRCTFDKEMRGSNLKGAVISNCLFRDGYGWASATGTTMTGCLVVYDSGNGSGLVPATRVMDGCYVHLTDTDNPHYIGLPGIAGIDIKNCVFGTSAAVGNGDILCCVNSATGSVSNCIVLPNSAGKSSGKLLSTLNATGVAFSLTHNTACCYDVEGGLVHLGESGGTYAGMVSTCKSNLAFSSAASTSCLVVRDADTTPGSDAVTPAACDYNATWNGTTGTNTVNGSSTQLVGYSGLSVSAAIGAHDVAGNPGFVDATRKLETWPASKGQGATLAAALTLIQADPSLIASDLIPWVRAGFAPTAAAYNGTAHDGNTIGAVGFQSPASGGNRFAAPVRRFGPGVQFGTLTI